MKKNGRITLKKIELLCLYRCSITERFLEMCPVYHFLLKWNSKGSNSTWRHHCPEEPEETETKCLNVAVAETDAQRPAFQKVLSAWEPPGPCTNNWSTKNAMPSDETCKPKLCFQQRETLMARRAWMFASPTRDLVTLHSLNEAGPEFLLTHHTKGPRNLAITSFGVK